MAFLNTDSWNNPQDRAGGQSGHWLPALRPETSDGTAETTLPTKQDQTQPSGQPDFSSDTFFQRNDSQTHPRLDQKSLLDSHTNGDFRGSDVNTDSQESMKSQPPPTRPSIAESPWSSFGRAGLYPDDELMSDEDDERLDPAWGIKRSDSAQLLGSVTRSTTFPDFTPSSQIVESTFKPMPQVQPLPAPIEHNLVTSEPMLYSPVEAAFAQTADPVTLPPELSQPQESLEPTSQNLNWMEEEEEEEPSRQTIDLSLSQNEQLPTPDSVEARFEEGLPLVQNEEKPEDVLEEPLQSLLVEDVGFVEKEQDEEVSFFDKINSAEDDRFGTLQMPELERKSTEMVLGSLHLADQTRPDSPKAEVEQQDDTIEDQASQDFLAAIGKTDSIDSSQPETQEVEALWEAALDDDDFLVEDADDLLPDSDPGSPSSFTASLQKSNSIQQSNTETFQHQSNAAFQVQQTPPQDRRPELGRQTSGNPYAPHQPTTADLTQFSPTTYGNVGLLRPGLAPMNSFQSHLQQTPAVVARAESFVDQSKGGYKSPYDLPMEMNKPRRRAHIPQPVQTSKAVPPPPRSSSISDKPLQSPFTPTAPGLPTVPAAISPPTANVVPARSISASVQPPASKKASAAPAKFFEELPITSKPRPATSQGRYTPLQPTNIPPPQLPLQQPGIPRASPPPSQPSPPRPADPYAQYQLRPPERIDPFSSVPLQPSSAAATGPTSTRYSPAPPALSGPKLSPSPRYSPAPAPPPVTAPNSTRYVTQGLPAAVAQQPTPQLNRYASLPQLPSASAAVLPFQPRTSSPLAYHGKPSEELPKAIPPPPPPKPAHTPTYEPQQQPPPPSTMMPPPPPPTNYQRPPPKISPTKSAIIDDVIEPPRRTQTQSPSRQRPRPTIPMPSDDALNRPASVHGQPANRSFSQFAPAPVPAPATVHAPAPPSYPSNRTHGVTEELEFIQPIDETQYDPLQRWKGAPIFKFGFGGIIISTFPKHVPRYSVGHPRPQIKATVGEVSIRQAKDIIPMPDYLANFPGPLRSKSKKKELLTWISTFIGMLENDASFAGNPRLESHERNAEKILLWKIVRSVVENDGALDSNQEALKSVNGILCPEIYAIDEATASQYRDDSSLSGIYRPSGTSVNRESADPMAIETLRKHLLKGNRQAAVWHAVDCQLWSHALLISSTLDRSIWKQVVQEFVKQEVKTAGNNTEPLSALYEIFGGNLEESIDELVPPSARAGLQMLRKAESTGPTKNALEGLDRWRETLSLVINNRSQGDQQALAVLGRLLSDYGRTEASHICYLFSRASAQPFVFSGADDPQAGIVLLGADHRSAPFDFNRDQDSILLTEAYEFATLVLGGGATATFMPHLSVYKLQRASMLADTGYKAEAQAYCDSLAATLKSSTKVMPYYHPVLLGELEELSNRLKQVPIQSSGSWTKPSLEKVSGSVWNKFSSFVAGDDSDAESKGSTKDATEAGPFAKVTGTPSISRSGSQTDLYGSYPVAAPPAVPATIASSRYAPNGMSSARSSSEFTRGRASLDSQRSPPQYTGRNGRPSAYESVNMFQQNMPSQQINPYQPMEMSPPVSKYHATPPQTSYMPNVALQESPLPDIKPSTVQNTYMPTPPLEQSVQRSYEPSPVAESDAQTPTAGPRYGDEGLQFQSQFNFDQTAEVKAPSDGGYEPSTQSYEPPEQSYAYDPPGGDTGYVPYVPEPESPEEAKDDKSKKKSFMDDDDDDFSRVTRAPPPTHPSQSPARSGDDDVVAKKRANDAAADAAFRAAAEADASREKEKTLKPKSSWFGGWLGSKKEEGLDSAPAKGSDSKQVHRVHLGEKKMKLYYDEKLKKWVNPDNPDAALKSSTPPPPPRASSTPGPPQGPPRSTSTPSGMAPSPSTSNLGPPSGPPSRTTTPASGFGEIPRPGPPGPGTLAPPPSTNTSRPSTAMSNASSIDDLIGPVTGKKSIRGKKPAKAGRYVDVMAK